MNKSLQPTACPLCGSTSSRDYTVLFPANFRFTDLPKLFSARRLPDRIHYQLVQCINDGLVRSHPILKAGVLAKLYKESAFTYQNEVANLQTTYLRAMQPVLQKLKPKDAILEIGCGSGFMLETLRQLGFTNVYGIEPSTHAIAQATPSIRKRITRGLFHARVFGKKRFQYIFFLQTLDHIAEPTQFLRECRQLLKPGGYILSFHHNVESLSARVLGERSPIFDIEHTHLYSLKTTRAMFEKCGFVVNEVTAPWNTVSLSHLVRLLPLPRSWKQNTLPSLTVTLPLGNIRVIAQKPHV